MIEQHFYFVANALFSTGPSCSQPLERVIEVVEINNLGCCTLLDAFSDKTDMGFVHSVELSPGLIKLDLGKESVHAFHTEILAIQLVRNTMFKIKSVSSIWVYILDTFNGILHCHSRRSLLMFLHTHHSFTSSLPLSLNVVKRNIHKNTSVACIIP